MKRELRITEDGSHTLYVPGMDEPYHSIHGAVQESRHVFIGHGFLTFNKPSLSILEIGFGTGLNALLTLSEAGRNGVEVQYHAVEKYPLEYEEYSRINFEDFVRRNPPGTVDEIARVSLGRSGQDY